MAENGQSRTRYGADNFDSWEAEREIACPVIIALSLRYVRTVMIRDDIIIDTYVQRLEKLNVLYSHLEDRKNKIKNCSFKSSRNIYLDNLKKLYIKS